MFIAFTALKDGQTEIQKAIYHPGSNTVDTRSTVDSSGNHPRAVRTVGGNLLLAWVAEDASKVRYSVFNSQGMVLPGMPKDLASPNGWLVEDISLAGELNGNAIITWKDKVGTFVYYALVSPDGSCLTPSMAFLRASNAENPNILSGSTGSAIAPYEDVIGWFTYLPALIK